MSRPARSRGRSLNARAQVAALLLAGGVALSGGGRQAAARNEIPAAPTSGRAADDAAPTQSMRIDVRGAMAHVTVTRTMPCQGERRALGGLLGTSAADAVLDVALPERAALLEVEVEDGNRYRGTMPTTTVAGHEAYVEGLRSMGFTGTRAVFPEDSTFRVRLACQDKKTHSYRNIKYRFSVPLEISEGNPRLAFPAAADLTAPRTRVEVTVSPAGDVRAISIAGAVHPVHAGGTGGATELVAVRSRWVVSLQTARAKTGAAGTLPQPSRLMARASRARGAGASGDLLAWSIGAGAASAQPMPERVLFLIDRSRSVGAGGFEAERNLARRILELLPPSTRFDALFFDRGQQRLFPVARPATRAAITALEEQMVPARMSNGTDLAAALRAAGELLRREAADFAPRTLLVVLSDGAVGRPAAGLSLAQSVGALRGVDLMVAALSVRLNDEPSVSDDERRVLRTLASAAPLGGVERALRVPEVLDDTTVPAILETLRTGGDVHGLALASGRVGDGGKRTRPGAVRLAEVLAPGQGASGVTTLPPGLSSAGGLLLTPSGSSVRTEPPPLPIHPVAVDARWLAPLAHPAPLRERVLVSPAVAAMVEPARPAASTDPNHDAPRGYMERSVVRDALSLAFTPRARACYLNRSARTPAERDLAGKVRLALDLVRGEVAGVRIESSTLGHPSIEGCLRDAAFAIEVPRAYRNDEAVTAILNLVFRPRTPDRRPTLQESTGRELDLLVEAALKAPPDAGSLDATTANPDATPDAPTSSPP